MALLDLSLSRNTFRRVSLLDIARDMAALRRQRLALRRLDDAALKDIGVTRMDAEAEADRPLWDAPEGWR